MNRSSSTSNKGSSSSSTEKDGELRRGPWTIEEDTLLIHYITSHGEGRWNLLAKRAGLKRTGKSCRLRWLNYLNPDVKRGNLTPHEQLLILDLHSKWGNRWSKIAQYLPGRTDNEIKNYWRTRVQKQARHLKVDANSIAFQDIIRCHWMPRLLQRMEGLSSQSSMVSQNPTADPLLSQGCSELPLPSLTSPLQIQEVGPEDRMLKHQEHNSDSEQCTRSSISSIDSRDVPQLPQIPELATSPFQTNNCGFLSKDYHYVDIGSYAMNMVFGGSANPGSDNPMAEQDWECDFEDGLWSVD